MDEYQFANFIAIVIILCLSFIIGLVGIFNDEYL